MPPQQKRNALVAAYRLSAQLVDAQRRLDSERRSRQDERRRDYDGRTAPSYETRMAIRVDNETDAAQSKHLRIQQALVKCYIERLGGSEEDPLCQETYEKYLTN
jgi:hypothetical protein